MNEIINVTKIVDLQKWEFVNKLIRIFLLWKYCKLIFLSKIEKLYQR